jgi:hypothetical protein
MAMPLDQSAERICQLGHEGHAQGCISGPNGRRRIRDHQTENYVPQMIPQIWRHIAVAIAKPFVIERGAGAESRMR